MHHVIHCIALCHVEAMACGFAGLPGQPYVLHMHTFKRDYNDELAILSKILIVYLMYY